MKETEYDVIVVGAGTGGCTVAKIVGDKGYSVALVDIKKREDIGNKICGDGILEEGFLYMEKLFGDLKESVDREIKSGMFVFPDNSKIEVKDKGLIFDRHKMGQIILKRTLESGNVKLYDNCMVSNIEKNEIFVSNLKNKMKFSLKAKIIVDASGFNAVLRKRIKSKIIEKQLKPNEYGIIFREILKLKEKSIYDDHTFFFFNDKKFPHGYAWVFPKKGNIINVGLGFEKIVNKNPKESYYSFFNFKDPEILNGGGGIVPLRRPLTNLVENNFLMVGDTACQISPISGGGIYTSIIGGNMAAYTIINALKKQEYDIDTLWEYNLNYQKKYGKDLGKEELVKIVLSSLNFEDLKKIIKLMGKKASLFSLDLSFFKLNDVILKFCIKNLHLLKKIIKFLRYMQKIDKLYKSYPTKKEEFKKWNDKANILFDSIYDDFDSY
jgi:geranylgeranyl reductase family protein